MSRFIIKGDKKLSGEININGSKNAAVALISATLLTTDKCTLYNVPKIDDVEILVEIIEKLGVNIKWRNGSTLIIEASKIKKGKLDDSLTRKLRASILLMGPLMGRVGKMKMVHPGGCVLGKRPVGTHFDALRALGADITQDEFYYYLEAKKIKGKRFYLTEKSVTATENAVMASVLAKGKTEILNAASERHVVALCQFLNKMGANISGAGTHTIGITGVKELNGADYVVPDDELEIGSFIALAMATKSNITLLGNDFSDLEPITHKAQEFGVNFKIKKESMQIIPKIEMKAAPLKCYPWPGFPTDLLPQFTIAAIHAKGISLVHEWMYERRLSYTDELIKMGANITLCDPHRALIYGPTKLYGTTIISPDIRAGMALVIAGLAAVGKTTINNVEIIERGYYKLEERLRSIGADIKRLNN